MPTTTEIFRQVLPVLSSTAFLDGSLARPNLPFYICPFDAERQDDMDTMIGNLVAQLKARGIAVLVVDLFQLMVERMKENGDLEFDLADEPGYPSRSDFLGHLAGILDLRTEIVPAICARIDSTAPGLLFVKGVGAAYPVIRAHALLQALESIVKIPLVLFFPGAYRQIPGSGATLSLFDKLPGDGYYRAFNLLDISP